MSEKFETVKTVHPRKNFDLWVVKLTVRIPKNEFMDLYNHARTLRGWYSSYNRDGAIPGFQFKSETAAKQFTGTNTTTTSPKPVPNTKQPKHITKQPAPSNPKPEPKPKQPEPNFKLAAKWEMLANSYLNLSKNKFKELENTQSNTPKRMRQYNQKMVDAQIFFDAGTIAMQIGQHIAEGTLPKQLSMLEPVKSKQHITQFVPGHESNDEAHRASEPWWIKSKQVPSIPEVKTFNQAIEIYNILQSYLKSNPENDRKVRIKALEDKVRFAKINGFFPTPPELTERLVALAKIEPNNIIIEPSAGMGTIAEKVREQYPNNKLFTVEINHTLAQILEAKQFQLVINDDFLNRTFAADRIIMNPPFENRQDVAHVQHAYDQLNPGGRLVAIMSAGPFHGTMKRDTQFQQWLYDVGADYFKNDPDAFKSAFRSTGVQTYTVIINKN